MKQDPKERRKWIRGQKGLTWNKAPRWEERRLRMVECRYVYKLVMGQDDGMGWDDGTGQDGTERNGKLRRFVEKQGWGMGVKKWFDKTNIQRNKNKLIDTKTEWWLPEREGWGRTKKVKGVRYMVTRLQVVSTYRMHRCCIIKLHI